MIVDMHAHALSERFIVDLAKAPVAGLRSQKEGEYYAIRRAGDDRKSTLDPHLFNMETRLASLKRRGVERQLFGPPPFLVSWPGGAATDTTIHEGYKA